MNDDVLKTRLDNVDKRLDRWETVFSNYNHILTKQAVLTEQLINAVDHLDKTNKRIDDISKVVTTNREQVLKWMGALSVVTFLCSGGLLAKILMS